MELFVTIVYGWKLYITLGNFNYSLFENTSKVLTQTFLFENMSLGPSNTCKILNAAIYFILATKRFYEQLFKKMQVVSTDHKQANILMSLIICCWVFFKKRILFLSLLRPIEFLICFYFAKKFFVVLLIPGTLYISWCLANV